MIDYIPGGSVDVHAELKPFQLKQYDNNSHKLFLTIIDKDNPYGSTVNLEGHTVTAYFRLPDGSDEYVVCEIVKAKTGRIAVPFPGSVTQQIGTVQCEIRITGSGMSIISMRKFTFEVIESIYDSASIEATEKYYVLDELISRAQGYRNELDSLRAELDGLGLGEIRARLETIAAGLTTAQEEIAGLESLIATQEEFLSLFDRSYDVASNGGETGGDTLVVITAPSAPANVTATAGDSSIAISWSAVADAEYYAVERTTNGGSTWTTVAFDITGTNYTDSTAVAGTSYRYAVTAYRTVGSGTLSSPRSILSTAASLQETPVEETAPAAPTNVTAYWNASEGKVYVSWASVSGVSYTLERKAGSGAWGAANLTSANSYTDSSVTAGTTYQYRVTAHKGSLSSDPATVSMTVPNSGGEPETAPAAPASITATAGSGSIAVSWSLSSGAEYYTLERKAGDGAWGSVAQNYTGTSYTDTSVTAGTSYQYRVTAHKTGTSGVLSSSATTSSPVTAQADTSSGNVTLDAPSSVTATAGNGKNTITWSGATNAQYYTLERKEGNNTWAAIVSNYTGTSYTDTNVTGGISYQYRVTAHRMGTSGNVLSSSAVQSTAITAQMSTGDNWPTAAEIVNDIKVGWVLGGALECTGAEPKTEEIGTDDEGIVYERDWIDLVTTEYTFKAVKEMGFNAVRIPVTWNHHLIDDGNGNVTISPYFLKRVKKVVNWAYNLGLYVIINSHYDSATFSRSKDIETIKDENGNDTGVLRYSDYDYQRTGFTWKLDTSYQLFHADNSLDSSGNRENSNASACEHIRKLWTQIATAFKDYGDHLLFEGFNEIKGINANKNDDGTVTNARIQNVNNLNKAFISAVRSVDGNEHRTLLCQTFNAKNSGDVVSGFNVDIANTRDNYVAMAVAMFTDNTSEIGTTISALKAKGYPVVICSAGWSTSPSGEPAAKIDTKATFAGNFAKAVKDAGARMFWWDDYGQNHNLLNRDYTNAQMKGSLWDRLATAQAIVNNSGGTAGTGYCAGSDYLSNRNMTSAMAKTTPETAQTVVNNITVGWNLGNALDCCYDPVRMRDKHRNRVLGTAYEGIGYEIGWKDSPVTTQAMLDEVVDAGFNAIRIPITWNHHLRNKNLPYDHGQDLLDETFVSENDGKTYYKNTGHVEVASGLSDTADDVIISAPFLKRVKEVVDMALRAGFKYVIINTHHDTADYNTGTKKKSNGTITHPRSVDYARRITGLPTSWQSENPYQLWHASNWVWPASSGGYIATQHPTWSTDKDDRGIVPAAENDFNQTLKPAFIKVWELIAKEFKDYDYRLIFEGFNEILKSTRQWGDYHAIHVQRTNELNQAFIDTIRATGKDYSSTYNQNRVLSCQTYGALKESASVEGTKFSVSDKDDNNKILLQVHYYKNSHGLFTQAVDDIRNALEDSNIPIIFGEVGWDTNGSNEGSLQNVYTDTSKNSSYEFAYKLVNSLKNKNAKVFWWDNNKLGIVDKNKGPSNRYGLLNRHNVDAATHIERWSRPALLKGLIKGSGQTIDWIENISV